MPPSTSANEPQHDAYPHTHTHYALADSYAPSYDGLRHRKRAMSLVMTPEGIIHTNLASHGSTPFEAVSEVGTDEGASSPAKSPDAGADFRSSPQELFNSLPAFNETHSPTIAQGENVEQMPLEFETPAPLFVDHDDPDRPLRATEPPSVHAHQEHDKDVANPDVKVIISSDVPSVSPFVQGTQRKVTPGSSSTPCTSTPPTLIIHPTPVSSSLPSSAPSTTMVSAISIPSSISLLPSAVVANTTSTTSSFGASSTSSGTPLPMAFGALHTVPFYVSVVFGSIAGAALLAALVAWAFRFRSAARVRREERIFNCTGSAGHVGDDEDSGGWASWWSRPFMNRVGSGRESLATVETRSVSNYVSSRPQSVAQVNVGNVGNVAEGPSSMWQEWEQATGMSFGREMGVGSGTDMSMNRTVSSKRRHQAQSANAEVPSSSSQSDIPQRRSSYYVHPPPQTYDSPTQPLENPFTPTQSYTTQPRECSHSDTRSSGRSMGRVGLPRMDSLGSGVGLGLGLDIGSDGGMLRVMNRVEGDGMSVNTASRANTSMGMNDDSISPTPSTSTVRPSGSNAEERPSTLPLPSFASFPSVLNAIKTTFNAAFSPSQTQGEDDRFTRAPQRCGIKKMRKWTDMDAPVEETETEVTKPLSVSKKHSRRYSSAIPSSSSTNGNVKRMSLMRGISSKRVRDSFPVGLSKKRSSRADMRRLASSASRTSRMSASASAHGSRAWEGRFEDDDYGFDEKDSIQDDEGPDGRPRFLTRPSAASYLSSVSGVSAFSVNSSREELMTEREMEVQDVLVTRMAARKLSDSVLR